MKIYIITCNRVHNYGAVLQSYALQHYLRVKGHQAILIDYFPPYMACKQSVLYCGSYSDRNIFVKLLYIIYKSPVSIFAKYIFKRFRSRCLISTRRVYKHVNELVRIGDAADLYICGSDQIWNPRTGFGKDPAYFLRFVKNKHKRCSYAASIGNTNRLESDDIALLGRQIEYIGNISVREKSAKEFLHSRFGVESVLASDPVFLLDRADWVKLAHNSRCRTNDGYILIYPMITEPEGMYVKAVEYAKRYNLKIYSITKSPRYKRYCDRRFQFASPEDFIKLILDAAVVVTNSFHGTAFSIICHKQFFIFRESGEINERIDSLIDLLHLESDKVYLYGDRRMELHNVYTDDFEDNLNAMKDTSKYYLESITSVRN